MQKITMLFITTILLLGMTVPAMAQEETASLADIMVENPDFSILAAAISSVDLGTELSDPDREFTIFAPTNDAFHALMVDLNMDTEEDLLADSEFVRNILLYHVVEDEVLSEDVDSILEDQYAIFEDTLQGSPLAITSDGESIFVNDARVISVDTGASNGVIHAIDAVLSPPGSILEIISNYTQSNEPEFTILMQALENTGLAEQVNDPEAELTFFAPTDAAFEAAAESLNLAPADLLADTDLLTNILMNHMLSERWYSPELVDELGTGAKTLDSLLNNTVLSLQMGENGIKVNQASVTQTDLLASNGVIHVVDHVLIPG